MRSLCCVFLLSCSYFLISSPSYAASCLPSERKSLLASFSDHPPAVLNWSSTTDCCRWEGVACDPNSGLVTGLRLPSKGLAGGISASIASLVHLSHLDLSFNGLTGPLPDGLFSSPGSLQVVDLRPNMLQGKLPPNLPASIRWLDLSGNRFNGSIPPPVFREANHLVYFNVSRNFFVGEIPSSICAGTRALRVLDFSFNGFTGGIPLGIGECSRLVVLRMGFNSLSGEIPKEVYRIRALREVSLASNRLRGAIDGGITNLTRLAVLELQNNQLSGGLPRHVGKLARLEKLVLDTNDLAGALPATLMNCTRMRELRLGSNHFEGDLSSQNFSRMSSLEILDLRHNSFAGEFPPSIYACRSLRAVRLGGNNLEGEITSQMAALQSLSFLSITNTGLTNITGAIRVLMGCKKLRILFLSSSFVGEVMPDDAELEATAGADGFPNLELLALRGCQLSGRIPTWLKKLRSLQVLDLESNQLRGPIPSWLGSMPNLFNIILANNQITGPLPPTLCSLRALTSDYSVPDRSTLELPIFFAQKSSNPQSPPRQINRLSDYLREINLGNNSLRGGIPHEIGCFKYLQLLDLSYNNMSGSIPNEISQLSILEHLVLARNHLSGRIPDSLDDLSFLGEFNVSFNGLEGEVPRGTQMQSFGASAYEGNKMLCGPPLPNPCRVDELREDTGGREDGTDWSEYASMGLGFAVGFSTVCLTLLLSRSWRHVYFEFLTTVKDRIWVTVLIHVARMRRRY